MEKEFFKLINLAYDSQKYVKTCLDQENYEGAVTSHMEILFVGAGIKWKNIITSSIFWRKNPYRDWYVKEYGSMIPAVEIESSFWGSGKQTATYLIYPLDVKGEEDEK